MNIIIGTGSKSKVNDIKNFFKDHNIDYNITDLEEIRKKYDIEESPEDETTVEGNSLSKCIFYERILSNYEEFRGSLLITEDTGLFVKVLNDQPGVRTARFTGNHDYGSTNKTILALLNGRNDRECIVKSCITGVIVGSLKTLEIDSKILRGHIADEESEVDGFAFDTIFIPYLKENKRNRTMSELSSEDIKWRNILPRFLALEDVIKEFIYI